MDGVHYIENMIGHFTVRAVRPSGTDGMRHISDTQAPAVLVSQRKQIDYLPFFFARLVQNDRTTKCIRIWDR